MRTARGILFFTVLLIFSANLINKGFSQGQLQPKTDFSEEQAQPKIQFSQETWDFGTIIQREKTTHVFTLKNAGEGELIILRVRTSCGCMAALISSRSIAPGDEGKIEVTFDSHKRSGKQKKRIYVDSNDPDNPQVSLTVTGFIEMPPPAGY